LFDRELERDGRVSGKKLYVEKDGELDPGVEGKQGDCSSVEERDKLDMVNESPDVLS
jgi:hypothetical protein